MSSSGKFDGVIIVSDMDGTYIANDATGARRNREAIEYLKENGGHFTFATGRNLGRLFCAEPDAREVVDLPVITCNGASIYDISSNTEISSHKLDMEYILKILDIIESYDPSIAFRGATVEKFLYYKLSNPCIKNEYEKLSDDVKRFLPINEWDRDAMLKISLRGDDGVLTRLYPIIKERLSDKVEIVKSDVSIIDIQAVGITKASGIQQMLRSHFGDRKMFLCVAGDYDNDLEMMSIADMPCCPQNAAPKVLELCKSHFCHCNDGLIGDIVEHLDRVF